MGKSAVHIGCIISSVFMLGAAYARDAAFENAPYMNPALSVDARLDDLVSKMTLEEKIAAVSTMKGFDAYEIRDGEVYPSKELKERFAKYPGCGLSSFFRADWCSGRNWTNGLAPGLMIKAYNAMQRYAVENTRLGIPLELLGVQFLGETTVPSGLGCAAMFDREALAAGTRMRLRERRTFSRNWYVGHPTCDLALDPRWSRVEQTFGEDPYLSAEYAYTRSKTAADMGGVVYLSHFICHGFGEGGHMFGAVHVGMNELLNIHMRPFEYAVRGGGASSIMTCYNLVDGVPGVMRGDLVNGFIRGKLGYRGTFMADAGAITLLSCWGFAEDLGEAVSLAVKNGNDQCCWEADNYIKGFSLAFERGLVTMEELDTSVRRCLRSRFEQGLFENPYIDPAEWAAKYGRPEDVIGCREHRKVVLDMARKSMTLLENKGGVLPLDAKKIRKLAVIGPNADKPENQLGDYTAPQRPGQTITPRAGFEALGKELGFDVSYARGCRIRSMNKDGFKEALAAAEGADAVVICLGGSSVPDQAIAMNFAGTARADRVANLEIDKDAGEGYDRASLRLGGVQLELLKAVKALGKPVVTVLIMGRPIVLEDVVENSDAVLLAWYPGTEGGTAVAETVMGLNNPGGKLPVSFPRSEGTIPCFYHAMANARENYVDSKGSAAYSFGYGLSYTTFDVSQPRISGNVVSVDVTNTGSMRGDDVVQMYLNDAKFSFARPLWELRGFKRVTLEPGEKRTVSFELTAKELGIWKSSFEYVVEPGEFNVAVWDRFDFKTYAPVKGSPRCVTYTMK